MTFDLEEWFHILDLPVGIRRLGQWPAPSRIEKIVPELLEMLSELGVLATFFVLGQVGEKHPDIIKQIAYLGHEVASHGYSHELIYEVGPHRFREDIRRGKAIVEDLIGCQVIGYRGPGFSITLNNLWALDIIVEEGFRYDATLYPGIHAHGGIPGLPSAPFTLMTLDGHLLDEFPVSVFSLGKLRCAFSGGGYFRLFPFPVITQLIKSFNKRGKPVMFYIHPRDLDAETPRLPMPFSRRFKCYVNISGAHGKLVKILHRHAFCSVREWRTNNTNHISTLSLTDLFKHAE